MSQDKAHTDRSDARNGRSSGATAVVLLSLLLGAATLATQIATLLITSQADNSASVQLANVIQHNDAASVQLANVIQHNDAASVQLANVIQHNDADNISSRSLKLDDILTASTYAPMRVAPSLQDFVGLSPTQIENIERVAITVPHDWECQARVSGGVHPCPHGIPSPCRYYLSTLYTDQCVLKYCSAGGPGAGGTDWCCAYLVPDSTDASTSATSWLHNMPSGSIINPMGATSADESYHNSYDTVSTGPNTVGQNLATAVAADATVCDAEIDVLAANVWGASDWWDEPNMDVSYINFKVVRFEMGQGLGLQLYSVQSDVIIIRPDKTVQFKPIGGENEILINPELTFTPPAVTARRELETSTMSPKKAEAHLAAQHKKAELQRFTGSCHPFHGCPAAPKTDLVAKIRARRALQPKTSPRQLEEERRQLGFFSALMTSGNFMMMQAGAF